MVRGGLTTRVAMVVVMVVTVVGSMAIAVALLAEAISPASAMAAECSCSEGEPRVSMLEDGSVVTFGACEEAASSQASAAPLGADSANPVVPVTLSVRQTEARAALASINAYRSKRSLPSVSWDSSLESRALSEAARRIVSDFASNPRHVCPRFDYWTMLTCDPGLTVAEALDDMLYGETEEKLLRREAKSIALVCVEHFPTKGDVRCDQARWFLALSYDEGDGKYDARNGNTTFEIPIPDECIKKMSVKGAPLYLFAGDAYDDLVVEVEYQDPSTDWHYSSRYLMWERFNFNGLVEQFPMSDFTWSSKNSNVVSFATGDKPTLQAGKAGATTVKATWYNTSLSASATVNVGKITRLFGDTALDTMKEITSDAAGFSQCDTVILATMGGYWDALTASGLAGVLDCPTLLTDGSKLSSQAKSEIKRLKAKNVIIVGGSAAVSTSVEKELRAMNVKVSRAAGDDAAGTAVEIYERGGNSWGKTAIIATSYTFHDALSVSPYSFAKRYPVFLTNSDGSSISTATRTALRSGGFERVVIVGGTAAVKASVEKQVRSAGVSSVDRWWGATSIETSSHIALNCIKEGMSPNGMGVATAWSYYDALSGAAFCGRNNAVLVLASDSNRSAIDDVAGKNRTKVTRLYVLGGPAAVSKSTFDYTAAALR